MAPRGPGKRRDGDGEDGDSDERIVRFPTLAPNLGEEFSAEAREQFCALIRQGARSRADVARAMGEYPGIGVIQRWIDDGRAMGEKGGKRNAFPTATDLAKRKFYIDVMAAEAERNTVGDAIIMREARLGDWRAAEAYQKRSERLAEAPLRKRILKAEAEEREAQAAAARARQRIMAAQADIIERTSGPTADMVLFPPAAIQRLKAKDPAKAKALEALLVDAGIVSAPDSVVDAVVKSQDETMASENERLAKEYGIVPSVKPTEPHPSDEETEADPA